MPRLSPTGHVAMGVGGHQGVIDGEFVPDSFGPYWMTGDLAVFGQPSNYDIVLMPIGGARTPSYNFPYNDLRAGGNVWAAWSAIQGLRASTGYTSPVNGLLDVGPDGAIGVVPNRQIGWGCDVLETNGEYWVANTDAVVYDLQLLGAKRAIFRDHNLRIRTVNLPSCIQIGSAYATTAVEINGEWWVCYFSSEVGQVFHPFNSTIGYYLGAEAWGVDSLQLGQITKIVWSTTAGEGPGDYRERYINVNIDPRIELKPVAPPIVVPGINKKCWVTWFEFNQPPPLMPPGNSLLKIRYDVSGAIIRLDGTQFATWVDGSSVAEIEYKCLNTPFPCLAYWDARNWPSYPNLKTNDWLGLQAYCRIEETPAQFEANMRTYIENAQLGYRQIALICQCYTSNGTLTTKIGELVPVFARLARDYPQVNMLAVFSDQNRATGLNDHPEVRPLWQELFNSVTGEPGNMADTTLPLDVWDVIVRMHDRFAQECIDRHPNDMEAASREWTEMTNEQIQFSFPNEGFCWKSADPNRPPSKDSVARQLDGSFFGWDLLQSSSVNGPRNLVNYPPSPNDLAGQYPIVPGDPRYPEFGPTDYLGEPPVSQVSVIIQDYDKVARRSDPNGMLVRFDCGSPNPIVAIELDLLNDGEPAIRIGFSDAPRVDGRYCRALAFKPTNNGHWILRVTAWDNQGGMAFADGPIPVEVTF